MFNLLENILQLSIDKHDCNKSYLTLIQSINQSIYLATTLSIVYGFLYNLLNNRKYHK